MTSYGSVCLDSFEQSVCLLPDPCEKGMNPFGERRFGSQNPLTVGEQRLEQADRLIEPTRLPGLSS